MYDKVSANQNFVEREQKIEKFWADNMIFEKSIELRQHSPEFTFYDGPPTANGKPHIGHVLTRVIKDMIPRYKTMKGYKVPRKAGWDTHGLPVELEVEKMLGLDGKDQIEAYGMEPFIQHCKDSVWKYKGMWEEFSGCRWFLGRYGASVCYVRQQLYRIRMVGTEADLGQEAPLQRLTRSFLTALAAVHRFQAMKLHRVIRRKRTFCQLHVSR